LKRLYELLKKSVYESLKFLGVFKYLPRAEGLSNQDRRLIFVNYVLKHRGLLLVFICSLVALYLSFLFGFDKKVTAVVIIGVGLLTQLFTEMLALIALVPLVGPIFVKIISIPIIILINGIGYIVTFFAFRKGYKMEVAKSKMITTTLLIGILIGYVVGKLL